MSGVERAWRVLRAIVHEIRVEKVTFLAGSLAYHAFVSLLPLLVLLVLVLSALGPLAPTDAVVAVAAAALTEGAADALLSELRRVSRSRSVSLAGIAVLVWGTLRVFRGIDTAFSDIYETERANGFLDQLRDGIVVFLAFAGVIVIAGLLRGVVPDGSGTIATVGRTVAQIGGVTVALLPMYYVFPDTDVTVSEVVPGTLFAALGVTVCEALFGLYVTWSGNQPNASVIAAVLVFLTWLYVSGLVVLLGAVIDAVLSNRSRDVSIEPVIGGVTTESPSDTAAVEQLVADADRVTLRVGRRERTLSAPSVVDADDGILLRWTDDASDDGETAGDDDTSDDGGRNGDREVGGETEDTPRATGESRSEETDSRRERPD